jgi:hypothetical protein
MKENNGMSNDTLTDACGRALPWSAVVEIARGNMLASSVPDSTDFTPEVELLQWATNADGCFDDEQVAAYGHVYVTGRTTPGDGI